MPCGVTVSQGTRTQNVGCGRGGLSPVWGWEWGVIAHLWVGPLNLKSLHPCGFVCTTALSNMGDLVMGSIRGGDCIQAVLPLAWGHNFVLYFVFRILHIVFRILCFVFCILCFVFCVSYFVFCIFCV